MLFQRALIVMGVAVALARGGFLSAGWAQSATNRPPSQANGSPREADQSRALFAPAKSSDGTRVWRTRLGEGFTRGTFQSGFTMGAGFGNAAFGSTVAHDIAEASVNAGLMISDVVATNKWYRGNWEFMGELFSGAQFHPEPRYLVGLTPLLRYNFATGSRWVPFLTGGAGIAFTDIGAPDLGGTFQFDPQWGLGTHYFFRRNTALTLEYRWLHISNASIRDPNHGLNTQMFRAGITWFF